ncbi:MAG TPA: hypothetical protein DD384_04820 [Firmicutes bacterium]|nr:hypothetical protein [Bacillota bacterium]
MVQAGDVVTLTGYVSAYNNAWQLVYGNCEEWSVGTVSVTAASTFVLVGKTTTVTATLKNEPAAFKYSSSDTTIATVDETTGVVTGVKEGKVFITATLTVDGKTYSDTCAIEVTQITPKAITVSELIDKADSSNTNYVWDTKNIYQVKGIFEGYAGDNFGNAYLSDPETGKTVKIYGLSGTENAGFSYKDGAWKYSNPKNAETTIKGIVNNGEEVTLNVMFEDAKGVANIAGYVVEHKANEKTYASSINTPENGTASLSLTEPQKYGTKVEIVVAPNEGYVVNSVKVKTLYGEESIAADESGKYFYNVTCKNEVEVAFKVKPQAGSTQTLTITGAALGAQSSYSDCSGTIDGVDIVAKQICLQSNGIQMRTNKNGTTFIYNETAVAGSIVSITLYYNSEKDPNDALLVVSAGSEKMATLKTDGTATKFTDKKFVFTPTGNFSWFNISHTSTNGSAYIDSIDVVYKAA